MKVLVVGEDEDNVWAGGTRSERALREGVRVWALSKESQVEAAPEEWRPHYAADRAEDLAVLGNSMETKIELKITKEKERVSKA